MNMKIDENAGPISGRSAVYVESKQLLLHWNKP